MGVLERQVFVLNRAWQLIDTKSVAEAVLQMAAGAATALDIQGDQSMVPVSWEDWLKLSPRNEDEVIHTARLKVRMPTVIIAVNYARVPKRRPKFTLKNIARAYGNRCAYTGKLLQPHEYSKDHVIPRSRGGKDVPENVVLADREVNSKKGNRTPQEAGLPMPKIRKLGAPQFEPTHPDHEHFVIK